MEAPIWLGPLEARVSRACSSPPERGEEAGRSSGSSRASRRCRPSSTPEAQSTAPSSVRPAPIPAAYSPQRSPSWDSLEAFKQISLRSGPVSTPLSSDARTITDDPHLPLFQHSSSAPLPPLLAACSMPPKPPTPPIPPAPPARVGCVDTTSWVGGGAVAGGIESLGDGDAYGVLLSSPSGSQLQIDILSTWGDPHYVGLSALEFFDEEGQPIEGASVSADPADINVLAEYTSDVRVASNLTDGVLQTCDDRHLWLAPYSEHRRNLLFFDLGRACVLSMVRVWNYNKSRTHAFRGARMIEMRLDGCLVFRGEINKAPGNLHDALACAEPILFTTDPRVIARIEAHDTAHFEHEPVAELPSASQRPLTAELDDPANVKTILLPPLLARSAGVVRAALTKPWL